jgi:IstB-like ATP binding protein
MIRLLGSVRWLAGWRHYRPFALRAEVDGHRRTGGLLCSLPACRPFDAEAPQPPDQDRRSAVDELGYLNLKPDQTNIFFKLMEERYRLRPTIITTNLDYPEWPAFLGNKALVEALLSSLRHQCHTVRIDGPTLRDPQR